MLVCKGEQFFAYRRKQVARITLRQRGRRILGSAGCQPALRGSLPRSSRSMSQNCYVDKDAPGKLPDAAG
jgi:hypothetical protein